MTGKELAAVLTKPQYANAHVLMKVANDWCEVTGVAATGEHRNGITPQVTHPALDGGVIVVEPDA